MLTNNRLKLNACGKFHMVMAIASHQTPQRSNISWLISEVDERIRGSLLFLWVGAVAHLQELGEVIVVHGAGVEKEGGEGESLSWEFGEGRVVISKKGNVGGRW